MIFRDGSLHESNYHLADTEACHLNRKAGGRLFLVIMLPLFILAMLSILFVTPYGVGTSPDSVSYINGARYLAAGNGVGVMERLLTLPMTHRPPLYSILLASVGMTGVDVMVGARWLQAILFAANLFLFGWLAYRASGRLWLAAAGAFLLLASAVMLIIHAHAWSEGLFLFLSLLTVVILERHLEEEGGWKTLALAAIVTGLACLTRYAGLPLIAMGSLGVLLFGCYSFWRRVGGALVFGALSVLPLALWLARNQFVVGTATNRTFAFHPIGRRHLWQALYTASGWLQIPSEAPDVLRIVLWLAIGAAAGGLIYWRSRRRKRMASIPAFIWLFAIFVALYTLFLLMSISFLDANTPLDDRILSPVYVSGLLLIIFLAGEAIRMAGDSRRVAVSAVVGVPLALLAVAYVTHSASWVTESRAQGLGYSSPQWQQSPLIAEVYSLPADTIIYSNAPEVIELLAKRPATPLPRQMEAMTQTENADYEQEVAAMKETLEGGEGVVVFFNVLDRPVMTTEELHRNVSLHALAQVPDGVIYGADNRK